MSPVSQEKGKRGTDIPHVTPLFHNYSTYTVDHCMCDEYDSVKKKKKSNFGTKLDLPRSIVVLPGEDSTRVIMIMLSLCGATLIV